MFEKHTLKTYPNDSQKDFYCVINLLFKPPEVKYFEKCTLKTNQNGSRNHLQSVISFLLKLPEAKFFEKYTLKTYSSSMYHVPIVGYIIKWNVNGRPPQDIMA